MRVLYKVAKILKSRFLRKAKCQRPPKVGCANGFWHKQSAKTLVSLHSSRGVVYCPTNPRRCEKVGDWSASIRWRTPKVFPHATALFEMFTSCSNFKLVMGKLVIAHVAQRFV